MDIQTISEKIIDLYKERAIPNINFVYDIETRREKEKQGRDLFKELDFSTVLSNFIETYPGSPFILDVLINIQSQYRLLFGWDKNVELIIEGVANLCAQNPNINVYFLDRILKPETYNTKELIDPGYFEGYCLVLASQTSSRAMECLWILWKIREEEYFSPKDEYPFFDASILSAIQDIMKEEYKEASIEVIQFLNNKLKEQSNSPKYFLFSSILNRFTSSIS
jgi:hypothetical protein